MICAECFVALKLEIMCMLAWFFPPKPEQNYFPNWCKREDSCLKNYGK